MTQKIYSIILITLFALSAYAQNTDRFVAHMDKPFYVTGEAVLYKLFLPEHFRDHEVAVQVSVLHENTTSAIFYIKSNGASYISSSYELPLDYSSGNYKLNFAIADKVGKRMITVSTLGFVVISDLEAEINIPTKLQISKLSTNELNCKISFQEQIRNNTEQDIRIEVTDTFGRPVTADLSISIIDSQLHFAEEAVTDCAALETVPHISEPNSAICYYGHCYNDQNEPTKIPVLGAYNNKTDRFLYTKSDVSGNFLFEIPDFDGEKTYQFVRHVGHESNVTYTSAITPFNDIPEIDIPSSVLSEYVIHSKKLKLIKQYFGQVENNINEEDFQEKQKLEKAPSTYNFKEYRKFETLGNFFKELITPLSFFTDDKGIYSSSMTNPSARRNDDFKLKGSPLYIIDGLATKNSDLVGRIDFENVETVELYHEPKQLKRLYNVMGIAGAVRVTTNLPDFSLSAEEQDDILTLSGIQKQVGELKLANSVIDLPQFSPRTYWNPTLTTDQNGLASFSFRQSADVSEYMIIVVAKSTSNEVGSATYRYKVTQ